MGSPTSEIQSTAAAIEQLAKSPCHCHDSNSSHLALIGSMLTNLGRFLTDTGLLISEQAGNTEQAVSTFEGREILPRYQLCDCKEKCCDLGTDKSGKRYFCKTLKPCENSNTVDCGCHLFRADKSNPKDRWHHRADPGQTDPEDMDTARFDYTCICVRDSHRGPED